MKHLHILVLLICVLVAACNSPEKTIRLKAETKLGKYVDGRLVIEAHPASKSNDPIFMTGIYSLEFVNDAIQRRDSYVWDAKNPVMPDVKVFLFPDKHQFNEIRQKFMSNDLLAVFGDKYVGCGWGIIRNGEIMQIWYVGDVPAVP